MKDKMKDKMKISKRISYLLRHDPQGLNMDIEGWVCVDELLSVLKIDKQLLDDIVNTDDKSRYSYDSNKIRANQGHTIGFVDIKFIELEPPVLYHGTSPDSYEKIMISGGIDKMSRQYVHLSNNKKTAFEVGKRHSKKLNPVILEVDAKKMHDDGFKFYLSDNKVWLTEYIPFKYLKII